MSIGLVRFLKLYAVYIIAGLYILGNAYVLAYNRPYFYYYNIVPFALFIIYAAIFHLQQLVFFLAFATPLSVTLKDLGMTEGLNLSLPTEPVMACIMLLYMLNQLSSGLTDQKYVRHSISQIIIIQILWMIVTTITSTDVVVSIKYVISRLWFVFSCYVIMPHLFQSRKNIITFVMCYSWALVIVVFYTLARHAAYVFNFKAADWVVDPFYNDHTAYGAALAMFIPVLFSFTLLKSVPKFIRGVSLSLLLLFILAIILSYARAGWLSLGVALLILGTMALNIRFRPLVITSAVLTALFLIFQTEIIMVLGRNNVDAEGDFSKNLESMTNISTDASNLERLNRWSCAIRMWEDKPIFGWGPGTYMFKYAPYQLSGDLTIISTNFGDNGNAHSEYLGPLSEQGVFGLLIVLALLFYCTSMGYRLYYTIEHRDTKIITMGLFMGLMTYFVHGFLNNFLDTDKLSVPFWAFLSALVSIDIFYRRKRRVTESAFKN